TAINMLALYTITTPNPASKIGVIINTKSKSLKSLRISYTPNHSNDFLTYIKLYNMCRSIARTIESFKYLEYIKFSDITINKNIVHKIFTNIINKKLCDKRKVLTIFLKWNCILCCLM